MVLGKGWECCGSERKSHAWLILGQKDLKLWLSDCIRSKSWECFTFYPRVLLPGQSFHPSLFMSNSSIINAQEMTFDPQALFWRPCHIGMQEPVEKTRQESSTIQHCVCMSPWIVKTGQRVMSSSQSCHWNISGDTLSSLDRPKENKLLSRKWTGRKRTSPQKLPFTRKQWHTDAVKVNPELSMKDNKQILTLGRFEVNRDQN